MRLSFSVVVAIEVSLPWDLVSATGCFEELTGALPDDHDRFIPGSSALGMHKVNLGRYTCSSGREYIHSRPGHFFGNILDDRQGTTYANVALNHAAATV